MGKEVIGLLRLGCSYLLFPSLTAVASLRGALPLLILNFWARHNDENGVNDGEKLEYRHESISAILNQRFLDLPPTVQYRQISTVLYVIPRYYVFYIATKETRESVRYCILRTTQSTNEHF